MNEKPKPFQELLLEKCPNTLDIIKIDGRWAQVSCGGAHRTPIKYLDTNENEIIFWDEYVLIECYENVIKTDKDGIRAYMQDPDLNRFTEKEIDNIYYDAEHANDRNLKMLVHVFGEYRKKDKN